MTEKLYDKESHLREFTAHVLSCEKAGERWAVILDQTAFFPEGGGQTADTGILGSAIVLDVQETKNGIVHFTDAPLESGLEVAGSLNWDIRFRRMQNHSGEHILSGLVRKRYGYRNVGFHLGDGDVTVDFDGELTRQQLDELETEANRAITDNLSVTCWYPGKDELAVMDYRSKLELTNNVRIVRIGDLDLCACCAPHVSFTGEIGSLRILDFMRHRGGVRLHVLCGMDAMDDARARYRTTLELSGLLSVPQLETPNAVRRMKEEIESEKRTISNLRRQILEMKAAALPESDGNICIFEPDLDIQSLRELVNAGMEKVRGICAAFTGPDGDRKYIIGSRSTDLRKMSVEINAAIGGRGGGRPEMIQGSCTAFRDEIETYFLCRKAGEEREYRQWNGKTF